MGGSPPAGKDVAVLTPSPRNVETLADNSHGHEKSLSPFRQNTTATDFLTSRANYCLPRRALCGAGGLRHHRQLLPHSLRPNASFR